MPADPFRIFAGASSAKQEILKNLWPELYEALAKLDQPEAERVITCVIGSCPYTNPRPRAVGRLTRNGHPACRAHIAKMADRVGGWPLKREEDPPR